MEVWNCSEYQRVNSGVDIGTPGTVRGYLIIRSGKQAGLVPLLRTAVAGQEWD